MGVADNKTYKDQYHFKDNRFPISEDEIPSVRADQPEVNTTIKKNPYRSNVEIEGKEIVLQPDMSALFKAVGKKHSGGGIDVLLKPDSFVFSNDKSLSFKEKEQELFEFKKGGKITPAKSTPAEVLKKNVDIKHYNTLIANIKDPIKDDLAKKSSALMLEKYVETLGNIAYLQESKKGFPQGIPDFVIGTAPVYRKDIKDDIMESKQYAKYGGLIELQGGGDPNKIRHPFRSVRFSGKYKSFVPTQDYVTGKDLEGLSGAPIQGEYSGAPIQDKPPTNNPYVPQSPVDNTKCPCGFDMSTTWSGVPKCLPCPEVIGPTAGTVTGEDQKGIGIDWQFTPYQKISQLYNFGKRAKRYMPYRSHYTASFADPALINPEQGVADAKAMANFQINSLRSVNPILRNAQASSAYGQFLDKVPSIRSQVDNQNAQIKNQFRGMNTQIRNQQSQINMHADQEYYQQSVVGQQNFDNMKTFLNDKAMSEMLQDVSTNQSLAYGLASRDNPAYGFDFRSGNFYRNKKDIRDGYGTAQGDYLGSLLQGIDFKSLSNAEKIQFIRELQRGKALQYLNPGFGQSGKKGGKMGNNPYKQ